MIKSLNRNRVFTRKISVLSELVEEAHRGYQHKIKPYVTIFLADSVRARLRNSSAEKKSCL